MTILIVKKWHDSRNGNTYHTVRGIRPRVSERRRDMTSGVCYGYGDSFIESWSDTTGEDNTVLRNHMRDFPGEYVIDITEVQRKRDLK